MVSECVCVSECECEGDDFSLYILPVCLWLAIASATHWVYLGNSVHGG